MSETSQLVAALLEHLRLEGEEAHRRVLLLVDPLDEEQLRWRARPSAPSIGFHLWHLARWADYDAQLIDGTTQVWQQRVEWRRSGECNLPVWVKRKRARRWGMRYRSG
jgi:hypothetical protein